MSCNLKYPKRKKIMGKNSFMSLSKLWIFKAPIFPKLTTVQRYYVEISCIGSHPNRSGNMESADRDSFTQLSELWLSLSRSARTSRSFDSFYKELLYQISVQSHTWFSSRYYVKDRRTHERHSCPRVVKNA